MCDCQQKINQKLEPYNAIVCVALQVKQGALVEAGPTIETVKKDSSKRWKKKPPLVISSYCPFCGERIIKEDD